MSAKLIIGRVSSAGSAGFPAGKSRGILALLWEAAKPRNLTTRMSALRPTVECPRTQVSGLLLGGLLCLMPADLPAQVSLRGELGDFVAPGPLKDRRKTTFYGKTGKQLANGLWQITELRVESSLDGKKDVIGEAPRCLFDPKSNIAYSDGELFFRKADESFSIRGRGFRWQRDDSRLFLSNAVHTVIRKPSSATNAVVIGAPTVLAAPMNAATHLTSSTNSLPSPAETIEIDSDQFDYRSDLSIFIGNVRVNERAAQKSDPDRHLNCGRLSVFFAEAGGAAQRIEAQESVAFEQGERRAFGQKAVYLLADDFVTMTGDPHWKVGNKEGSGEVIYLNNKTKNFRVERHVSVRLPRETMAPLAEPRPPPANAQQPNAEPLTIAADALEYQTDSAVFRGHVRAADPGGGTLSCELLTTAFAGPESKLKSVIAEGHVELTQGETSARGDRAVYDLAGDTVTLTGNPTWKISNGEGRGERVILNSKTRQIQAERNVWMKLLQTGAAALDLSISTASPARSSSTNDYFEVFSDELYYKTTSAIFLNHVRVISPRERANDSRELTSEVLAAFFGEDKKLENLTAEEDVRIRQGDLHALGHKAIYNVPKGWVELTGDGRGRNPEIGMPGRRYLADGFVLDRGANIFRMKGHYRIEMEQDVLKQTTRANANE